MALVGANLGNLTCPALSCWGGWVLSSVEARLCLSETATVRGILGTMLVTVALVVAECKHRRGSRGAGEGEQIEMWTAGRDVDDKKGCSSEVFPAELSPRAGVGRVGVGWGGGQMAVFLWQGL